MMFTVGYERHRALDTLVPAAAVCLLCLEADAQECHRSVIVEALGEQVGRLEVVHLT